MTTTTLVGQKISEKFGNLVIRDETSKALYMGDGTTLSTVISGGVSTSLTLKVGDAAGAATTGAGIAIGRLSSELATDITGTVGVGQSTNRYTTGIANTAVGYAAHAGASGSTASFNTAVGNAALGSHKLGEKNVGLGYIAGHAFSYGSSNLFAGSAAAAGLNTLNVAGVDTITTTSASFSAGTLTLNFDAVGVAPFSVGAIIGISGLVPALYNSSTYTVATTSTTQITITGVTDRGAVTTGVGVVRTANNENVVLGSATGYYAKQLNSCAYIGAGAGATNVGYTTDHYRCVALGANSLNGTNSVVTRLVAAIGVGYLSSVLSDYGIAIGQQARTGTSGFNYTDAIAIGRLAVAGYANSIAIGYQSTPTGANQLYLGGPTVTAYAYGAVGAASDIRDKADVRDTVLGLDFITKLRPVDYKWDMRESYIPKRTEEDELNEVPRVTINDVTPDGSKKRNRFHHGFIAQEIQGVIAETGVDFGGFQDHSINGGNSRMTLGYDELLAPIVKALQELNAKFEAYKAAHP